MKKDTVGNRIREKRKEMGLSQEKLANMLGYNRTWLANIETDKRDLAGQETILKICDILKISPTYLLTGYDDSDLELGSNLGISGDVINSLREWQKMHIQEEKKRGTDGFPIIEQIDYIVSVLVNRPQLVMMLWEYFTADYTDWFSSAIHLGKQFLTTNLSDIEPLARFRLMDELKRTRDDISEGKIHALFGELR